MKKYLLALALVAGAASTAIAQDWDLNRDFSRTTNPNGAWSYIVYLEDGFDWNTYLDNTLAWPTFYDWPGLEGTIGYWGNPGGDLGASVIFYNYSDADLVGGGSGGTQWFPAHKVALHPAANDCCYFAGARWTAPADMQIQVHAFYYGLENTSTTGHVILNGNIYNDRNVTRSLWDAQIIGNYGNPALGIPATNDPGNHAEYNATLIVNKGDKLDFAIDGQGWYGSDLTGLDVAITKLADVPQPNDWNLARDFALGSNPHRDWTYGVYLEDALNPTYPDGWYTWPAFRGWPGSPNLQGAWSNYGDLTAGAVFYTMSDLPVGGTPPTYQWWAPHTVALHPACACGGYQPVIRWTAPADMRIVVDATFFGCETTTTTQATVLLNGDMTDGPFFDPAKVLFTGTISGTPGYEPLGVPATGSAVNYNAVLNVLAGDKLDFTVGCYADTWCSSDLTGVDITIAPACTPVWADADGDSDVDQADFGAFQACYMTSTPQSVDCRCFERAGDPNTIASEDLTAFLACWSGPNVVIAACP